jgi:hypothetical protein
LSVFYLTGTTAKLVSLFAKARDMIARVGDDSENSRGTVRFLTIRRQMPPECMFDEMIRNSELSLDLMNEQVNDWGNFQMLRKA